MTFWVRNLLECVDNCKGENEENKGGWESMTYVQNLKSYQQFYPSYQQSYQHFLMSYQQFLLSYEHFINIVMNN